MLEGDRLPPMQAALISNNLAFHLLEGAGAGDVEEAKKLIDFAIVELGPNPELLDTRALVWLAMGEPQKAISDLTETLILPTPQKHLHLAAAHLAANNIAGARISFNKAIKEGIETASLGRQDREMVANLEKALGKRPR